MQNLCTEMVMENLETVIELVLAKSVGTLITCCMLWGSQLLYSTILLHVTPIC